jgi:hypothetical protein
MSQEITIASYLQYANAAVNVSQVNYPQSNATKTVTINGKNYQYSTKSYPTTAGGTAIPLGGVGTLGWAIFQNLDPTNYAQLLSAVSGTVFARLIPLEPPIVFRFDSGITAPAILANTAAVIVASLILEN